MHDAVFELPEPVSAIAAQPAIELPPLVKVTLPVGLDPVTVAVNITLWLILAGLTELASATDTGGGGGAPPVVQASTSATNEAADLPPSAALMTTRILLVVVAAKDTVRLTRLLPLTEPCVTQAEPF